MSIVYLDASALVKQYIAESGSAWVRSLLIFTWSPTVFISCLTVVEAACAFARRQREGTLLSESYAHVLTAFDYDITYRYNVLDVTPAVIDTARRLAERHSLRAYDAVQLATALLADRRLVETRQSPLTFICADEHLTTVAQSEGLLTDNPNHHP